ncbi:DUF362 domain-containing protein [Halococcus sp. IIIV-5B]|uniref:DUF362 domain-containing protein n=1 Tax=Halococcus sp. IIIV-5B TaxID=2321230 RepID=UPI000E7405BB|nr:DUF362 domain-containing protein [Halococcus sp. IIIV-5B]RJT06148.1 DUF362 domain-containing protein [Halococcus sp. IIIV-5B]
MNLDFPDAETLRAANDVTREDLPRFARVQRDRDLDSIDDVEAAGREAVGDLALDSLRSGAEVAVTAGSRGVHDMPALLSGVVDGLGRRGFEPFVMPAMGSHGGATADGQRETLETLGVTEDRLGCPVRSSMAVSAIGEDSLGRPVYVADDALAADGVVLANRVKPHTDFHGPVESGLCKMAVIGLGKRRGAESLHNAGLAADFSEVIEERARMIVDACVVGGVALVENAADRATVVEGVPPDRIPDREPELLDRARAELPMLPVDDLDLLVLDEIGKDVSGTGMDTNVVGRVRFHGEREPDAPNITRIYVRSITPASHGNGLGIGLADFAHRDAVAALDLDDLYTNIATSGEPSRARLPFVVPDDLTALTLACSTTGVADPTDLRVARIENTMEPDTLVVSEPLANELAERERLSVGPLEPLTFEAGTFTE